MLSATVKAVAGQRTAASTGRSAHAATRSPLPRRTTPQADGRRTARSTVKSVPHAHILPLRKPTTPTVVGVQIRQLVQLQALITVIVQLALIDKRRTPLLLATAKAAHGQRTALSTGRSAHAAVRSPLRKRTTRHLPHGPPTAPTTGRPVLFVTPS